MKRFAAMAGAVLLLGLGGCESFRLFNDYTTVESPEVADAPWPRLVDVPDAPEAGSYDASVPDPVEGVAVQSELGARAANNAARLEEARAPVLSEEERAELAARAERNRKRVKRN